MLLSSKQREMQFRSKRRQSRVLSRATIAGIRKRKQRTKQWLAESAPAPKRKIQLYAELTAEQRSRLRTYVLRGGITQKQIIAETEFSVGSVRNPQPTGKVCATRACPFPVMVGTHCRTHFMDSRMAFSLLPSTAVLMQEIAIGRF